ncbi:hypothetical protein R1T08_02045 [Streptomyces sp. SBC-4]|nr:hypothetical protein [Streptomyces sp. SBC-4]MDV5143127.1 hypothetical protein [Streptomyces sp. SBC-4]
MTRRSNAVGQSLTYERDALGRVVRLVHDDGTAAVFAYDATGSVDRATNPHADTSPPGRPRHVGLQAPAGECD